MIIIININIIIIIITIIINCDEDISIKFISVMISMIRRNFWGSEPLKSFENLMNSAQSKLFYLLICMYLRGVFTSSDHNSRLQLYDGFQSGICHVVVSIFLLSIRIAFLKLRAKISQRCFWLMWTFYRSTLYQSMEMNI